jgi:hypothetical protein
MESEGQNEVLDGSPTILHEAGILKDTFKTDLRKIGC